MYKSGAFATSNHRYRSCLKISNRSRTKTNKDFYKQPCITKIYLHRKCLNFPSHYPFLLPDLMSNSSGLFRVIDFVGSV